MIPKLAGFLFLALVPLVAVTASAQPPPPEPELSETIDVEAAEVEVFVTDRDGRPVPGLAREDFQVLEDGQPVEITDVSFKAQPLILAVFFDETSLEGLSRAAVVRALKSVLSTGLKPGDRVLITASDGSLKLLQEPTGDAAALVAALDRLAASAPRNVSRSQERNLLLREILQAEIIDDEQPTRGLGPTQATGTWASIRSYIQTHGSGTRDTLTALRQLVDSLSGLPGRKAVLYAGGGLPMRPGADLVDVWMAKFSGMARQVGASPFEASRWDASPLVQEVVDGANAGRVTLYGLGLPEGSQTSAAGEGSLAGRRARVGSDAEDSARALRTLAAGTGGLVAVDVQNPASLLEPMRRDLDASYSLGYTPATGRKAGKHRIEVKLRDASLTARHREDRFDAPQGDPLTRLALSTLLLGGGENPLQAALQFEGESQGEDGRQRVTAVVTLPLTTLLLQPQEHFHVGRLTVAVAARDGAGKVSGIPRAEVPVNVPNEHLLAASGQVAGYRFTLLLAPGESTVAAALRDETSGLSAVIRAVHTAEAPAGR